MYYNGEGVTQDFDKALVWFRRAAEQGFADAQFSLGLMHNNGEGMPRDYTKAVEWSSPRG